MSGRPGVQPAHQGHRCDSDENGELRSGGEPPRAEQRHWSLPPDGFWEAADPPRRALPSSTRLRVSPQYGFLFNSESRRAVTAGLRVPPWLRARVRLHAPPELSVTDTL